MTQEMDLFVNVYHLKNPELLQKLTDLVQVRRFPRGKVILHSGEQQTQVMLLLEGIVRGYFYLERLCDGRFAHSRNNAACAAVPGAVQPVQHLDDRINAAAQPDQEYVVQLFCQGKVRLVLTAVSGPDF